MLTAAHYNTYSSASAVLSASSSSAVASKTTPFLLPGLKKHNKNPFRCGSVAALPLGLIMLL